MVEVHQDRERLLEDLVGPPAFHLAHKADTTRVVLELRIVEALFFGWVGSGQLGSLINATAQ